MGCRSEWRSASGMISLPCRHTINLCYSAHMLTLITERSASRAGWALFRAGVCMLQAVNEPSGRDPAWLPALLSHLAAAGVAPTEIGRFAVGLGPGSFSGIRAAIAAFQGLALPDGKPLLGVSSAAAWARRLLSAQPPGMPIAIVGDARRDRIWCGIFVLVAPESLSSDGSSFPSGTQESGKRLAVWQPSGLRLPAHDAADFVLLSLAALPGHLPPGTRVATADMERLAPQLSNILPSGTLLSDAGLPTAEDVGALIAAEPSVARLQPVPIYLHPAVAEKRA